MFWFLKKKHYMQNEYNIGIQNGLAIKNKWNI
jgi:hypothetical protein